MKKNTKGKVIATAIISLFLISTLSTLTVLGTNLKSDASNTQILNNNLGTITVDDDRVECPNARFTSIQEAIDHSGDYGKIKVYPGTYEENVVTKYDWHKVYSVEGAPVTTIVGNGDNAVIVKGSWPHFEGFTIKNTAESGNGLKIKASWAIIRKNIFKDIPGTALTGGGDWPEVYHNDFVGNSKDVSLNGGWVDMDKGGSGNHWSKYNGADSDGDGIGDSSYNGDRYPLMRSWYDNVKPSIPTILTGPSTGIMGQKFTFTAGGGNDADGTKLRYKFHWGTDSTNHWPDKTSKSAIVAEGETASVNTLFYSYGDESKTVNIKVKSIDIYGYSSEYCEPIEFTMTNTKPNNPSEISGPTTVGLGKEATFTISTDDPDGHNVGYYVNWGDDSAEDPERPWEYCGTFKSGEKAKLKHVFNSEDTFTFEVRVQDAYSLDADQTRTFEVSVEQSKQKTCNSQIIQRILEKYPNLLSIFQRISNI